MDLIVGVISGEKDMNLRVLKLRKLFCNQSNEGTEQSFDLMVTTEMTPRAVTIVGVVDEDLGSISE